MTATLVALLIALAVASLVMVAAMVGFSGALIAREPRSRARWSWFALYALSWVVIVYVIARLPADASEETIPLGVLVLMPAGWATFNAFWIRAWFAIGRANERDGRQRILPRDADRITRRAARLFEAGVVLLLVAAWNLGWLRRLLATMLQPGRHVASALISIGITGFALFMTGAVRLALGAGRDAARGGSGQVELTVDELRAAWRTGLWRRDSQLLTVFLMLFGAIAGAAGAIGSAMVLGSDLTRIVVIAIVAYGGAMAWRGVRRGKGRKQNG